MKLFIPYDEMMEKFPKYGKPRSDHLICLKTGKINRIEGFLYEYGDNLYRFEDRYYRKLDRWEWDFHASNIRDPENSNAKFFKAVQDAYSSEFGE